MNQREIKFRCWDKINEKMLTNEDTESTTDWPTLLAVGLHGLPICIDKESFKDTEIVGWNRDHNLILEQWTGRQDKNGMDIYEGDLIYFHTGYSLEDFGSPQQVVFEDGAFRNCKAIPTNEAITLIPVVVGNIHENPEFN